MTKLIGKDGKEVEFSIQRDDCTWRYGQRPARVPGSPHLIVPNAIHIDVKFVGANQKTASINLVGRMCFAMTEGHFAIIDPANGGFEVNSFERGLIRSLDISAQVNDIDPHTGVLKP